MDKRNIFLKLSAGFLMGMLFMGAPVSVFASEDTDIEVSSETAEESFFAEDSSPSEVLSEQTEEAAAEAVSSECANAPYQTVTVIMNDPEQLTITMKGISEDNRDRILTQVEQGVDIMIMYNGSMKLEIQNLTDAEKYHLSGYDKELCWAGTAADMLWISGYAQQAVNPQTGNYFQSEDEVFDYFRHIFKDERGNPGVALNIYFTGDADSGASSWLKPDANPQPMVSEGEDDHPFEFKAYLEDESYIREFEKLTDRSFGAILHSIDRETNIYAGMAHAVTIAGIVYDADEENLADRYKAILIADSDNDYVLPNADTTDPARRDIPDDQKAQMAANAKNSYTLYTLSLKYYGEHMGYRWAIPYFVNPFSKIDVIIDAYAYLNDKVYPEKENCEKKEAEIQDTPSYICQKTQYRTEQPCLKAEAFIYGSSYKDYDFSAILKKMNKKDVTVYSPMEWKYTRHDRFHFFVCGSFSHLRNILLDGKPLLFCCMDVTVSDGDTEIFVIELSDDVMQTLSSGDHTLTIQMEGQEDITEIIHA